MGKTICAFTGHRPSRFSWGYDETNQECIALKEVLTEEIMRLTDIGVTNFLSGMAEGVDTWASVIVLALREKILRLNSIAFSHVKRRRITGVPHRRFSIALFWNRQILLFMSAETTTKNV